MNMIREEEVDLALNNEIKEAQAENELKRRYPNPHHRRVVRKIAEWNRLTIAEFLEVDFLKAA